MEASDLLRVHPDDPAYQADAAAEAAYWEKPHPYGLEALESRFPGDGPVERNANERFTGDPRRHWYDMIPAYGNFREGLILGTSSLRIEQSILAANPSLSVTLLDISPGAVERHASVLSKEFPGRVHSRIADLNFLQLESENYDLIITASSYHHVTNLEHCAFQINRALTPDGFFFFHDYVGEPRFLFSERKKRIFETVCSNFYRRQGEDVGRIVWQDDSNLSPFCARHSDESLRVLRAHLSLVRLRTRGALVRCLDRSGYIGGARRSPAALMRRAILRLQVSATTRFTKAPPLRSPRALVDELMLVGDVLSDAGLIRPSNAFAIYKKRAAQDVA